MVDHYAFGGVSRISPEAPIQILDIEKEEFRLGGAGNVAHNLAALGASVSMVGVVGEDNNGNVLLQLLQEKGIRSAGVFVDAARPTTIKTRLIAQGHHLLRTDRETRDQVTPDISEKMLVFVQEHLHECDGLVLSDYAKGVLGSTDFCQRLLAIARRERKVFVGPKGKNWSRYAGANLLSANRSEAELVTGIALKSDEDIARAAQKLRDEHQLETVVVTLGSKGMYVNSQSEGSFHIAAEAREVFDVAGAGDTVLSLLSIAVSTGCSWKVAARLANTAAGIKVGKVGTATVSPQELLIKLNQMPLYQKKIKPLEELLVYLGKDRLQGKTVVFTNGCFDLLHPGHLRYLEYCKTRGDILIVGLNSDISVRTLKGDQRPIMAEHDRAEVLAGLACVDYITIFSESTPAALIGKIRPDVLVKGSDWASKGVVGREFVENYGGKVELYELEKGYSTSNIIEKILQNYPKLKEK